MELRGTSFTVHAYVRPAQLLEPIDAKIETLRRLEETGVIESLSVHAWPDRIPLSERTPYSHAIDAFRQFEGWAENVGASVRPPFDVGTQSSLVEDRERPVLHTPVMCLALYVGDTLSSVFPHSRGTDHYGVTEALAALRTGDVDLLEYATDVRPETPPERCPHCDVRLANVQGVGVCETCAWVGVDTGTWTDREETSDRREIEDPTPLAE